MGFDENFGNSSSHENELIVGQFCGGKNGYKNVIKKTNLYSLKNNMVYKWMK